MRASPFLTLADLHSHTSPAEPGARKCCMLTELHQFAKFEDAKCLESLDQAPKGLHYMEGADRMAAAVILGEG
jgi:hypothetical protein